MAKQQWKVFFESDFWHHSGRDHAGKELRLDKEFEWAGHEWHIPAVYCCGKGLAVDFCMGAGRDALRAFMDKWKLPGNPEKELSKEDVLRMERDNPLTLGFKPHIFCNGKELALSKSCCVSYQPYLEEIQDMEEAKAAMGHYGLSDGCGWTVTRAFFRWNTKQRPEIRSLSVVMEALPALAPGGRFTADQKGDRAQLAHPENGKIYTLTVREYRHETLGEKAAERDGWEYPRHFDVMGYTVEPEGETIAVKDCADGEPARKFLMKRTIRLRRARYARADAFCFREKKILYLREKAARCGWNGCVHRCVLNRAGRWNGCPFSISGNLRTMRKN